MDKKNPFSQHPQYFNQTSRQNNQTPPTTNQGQGFNTTPLIPLGQQFIQNPGSVHPAQYPSLNSLFGNQQLASAFGASGIQTPPQNVVPSHDMEMDDTPIPVDGGTNIPHIGMGVDTTTPPAFSFPPSNFNTPSAIGSPFNFNLGNPAPEISDRGRHLPPKKRWTPHPQKPQNSQPVNSDFTFNPGNSFASPSSTGLSFGNSASTPFSFNPVTPHNTTSSFNPLPLNSSAFNTSLPLSPWPTVPTLAFASMHIPALTPSITPSQGFLSSNQGTPGTSRFGNMPSSGGLPLNTTASNFGGSAFNPFGASFGSPPLKTTNTSFGGSPNSAFRRPTVIPPPIILSPNNTFGGNGQFGNTFGNNVTPEPPTPLSFPFDTPSSGGNSSSLMSHMMDSVIPSSRPVPLETIQPPIHPRTDSDLLVSYLLKDMLQASDPSRRKVKPISTKSGQKPPSTKTAKELPETKQGQKRKIAEMDPGTNVSDTPEISSAPLTTPLAKDLQEEEEPMSGVLPSTSALNTTSLPNLGNPLQVGSPGTLSAPLNFGGISSLSAPLNFGNTPSLAMPFTGTTSPLTPPLISGSTVSPGSLLNSGNTAPIPAITSTTTPVIVPQIPVQQDAVEDDSEELFEGQRFWARVKVRSSVLNKLLTPDKVTIQGFSISPERRATIFGWQHRNASLQGGHLVAWSAMVRYWSNQLQGKLDTLLGKLEGWLIADDLVDDDVALVNDANRARAFQQIQFIRGTPMAIDDILNYFEQAASLFISTNQYSTFAVAGKSKGGNSEADGHAKLEQANEEKNSKNVAVEDNALTLIDTKTAPQGDTAKAKVVSTWYNMLNAMYPQLKPDFQRELPGCIIWQQSVQTWLDAWDKEYSSKKDATAKDLTTRKAAPSFAQPVGVWVLAEEDLNDPHATTNSSNMDFTMSPIKLKASEVDIGGIEIPAKLRAKTQFRTQQSHTISWTYKRQALEKMMENPLHQKADKFLELLLDLAKRDFESFESKSDLRKRSEQLCLHLANTHSQEKTFTQWGTVLNECLIEYIEVNQAHPMSTYGGADRATGHAEGYANEVFSKKTPTAGDLLEMKSVVTKYVDLGIFYMPLIQDLIKHSDLQKQLGNNRPAEPPSKKRKVDTSQAQPKKKKTWTANELFTDYLTVKTFTAPKKRLLAELPAKEYQALRSMVIACQGVIEQYEVLTNPDPHKDLDFTKVANADLITPLLTNRVINYGIQPTARRLSEIIKEMGLFLKMNPGMQKFIVEQIEDLEEKSVGDGEKAAEALILRQQSMINKLMSDFFLHLKDFHGAFNTSYTAQGSVKGKDDGLENKRAFVTKALLDPLALTDKRIGEPLKIHLGDNHQIFIQHLMATIRKKFGTEWVPPKDK